MPIPEFVERLERILVIHDKKNRDYAGNGNPFENFERSAQVSEWFFDPIDKVFVTLITTKMARLATLLNSIHPPNNESIGDSFDDLTTYCNLWGSYRENVANRDRVKLHPETSKYQCTQCGVQFNHEPIKLLSVDSQEAWLFHNSECREKFLQNPKNVQTAYRLF